MATREARRQLQTIRYLIGRSNDASLQDVELQGHWGRYLCILAAGYIEHALREVYLDFTDAAASRPVARFAAARLNSLSNPKSNRFIETAQGFNPVWADELTEYLNQDSERRKNSIDSIMNNRNELAHGRNTSISVARVAAYLDDAVEVIDFVESQCSGESRR